MYSLTFFAVDLFSRLELGGASTVAVAVAAARCAGTAAGCLLLLRTGRRRLHLAGSAAVCLAMGLVAAVVSLRGAGWLADRPASWALVCLFMLFMFLVGTSVVSLPWVLMGKSLQRSQNDVLNCINILCSRVVLARAEVGRQRFPHHPAVLHDIRCSSDHQSHPRSCRQLRPLHILLCSLRSQHNLYRSVRARNSRENLHQFVRGEINFGKK